MYKLRDNIPSHGWSAIKKSRINAKEIMLKIKSIPTSCNVPDAWMRNKGDIFYSGFFKCLSNANRLPYHPTAFSLLT